MKSVKAVVERWIQKESLRRRAALRWKSCGFFPPFFVLFLLFLLRLP